MYSVRRLGWQTLLVTDEDQRPISSTLQDQWRRFSGVAFVEPQHDKPHIVAISFDDNTGIKGKAESLMRQMIATLPESVSYCDIRGSFISESAWYR